MLRIINEPTAAALAYGLDKKGTESGVEGAEGATEGAEKPKEQTILVFDLGGGTFDVSLLKIEDGVFTVLSTAGDTHLGGEDFDTKLAEDVAAQWIKKNGEDIFTGDDKAQRKLRTACERARACSPPPPAPPSRRSSATSRSTCPTPARASRRCASLSSEVASSPSSARSTTPSSRRSRLTRLFPSSSRFGVRAPRPWSEFFDGKSLCKSVGGGDERRSRDGAAVQGAIRSGARDSNTAALLLVDVIPLSLGIEARATAAREGCDSCGIVPCKKKQEFTTV